jgi:hypothetical protein
MRVDIATAPVTPKRQVSELWGVQEITIRVAPESRRMYSRGVMIGPASPDERGDRIDP